MLSQKEAVYKVVMEERRPDGTFHRPTVVDKLFTLFKSGEVAHKISDDKALQDYCGSVLSNWLRKDERLNGGATSVTPREGGKKKPKPADSELKRLMKAKVLLKANGQPTEEMDALIEQREALLNAEQNAVKTDVENDAKALLATLENK